MAGGRDADLSISSAPVNRIRPAGAAWGNRDGAVIEFAGVVRGDEGGRAITGIEYSAYLPMAERELARIAADGSALFPRHQLLVHHVVGFVAAGEASLLVRVATPHSQAAFEACRWYLAEIKRALPVWKNPVFAGPAGGAPGETAGAPVGGAAPDASPRPR